MPLIVEALLMVPDTKKGGYEHNSHSARSVALVRQAVELGADAVKTDPLNVLEEYHKVIEAVSGKPVLLRGDRESPTKNCSLALMRSCIRVPNVYQHPHPAKMLEACSAIVHKNASVAEAQVILNGTASR